MPTVTLLSYRLGGTDGVAIEAAKWAEAFGRLGWSVRTVCGASGDAAFDAQHHAVVPGLSIDATQPTDRPSLDAALAGADLVVVENMLSLPMNEAAARAVAEALRGRSAIIHHHDMAWQRDAYKHVHPWPPVDPAWRHVCINRLTQVELAQRGIEATVVYNCFNAHEWNGSRRRGRAAVALDDSARVVLQPTRAIARKNVARGIELAERAGAIFWIPGAVEDGYDAQFATLVDRARCRVERARIPIADAYAAADIVAFPSTWEGFGNPAIESAFARRPLVIGRYPVGEELAEFGFRWHDAADPDAAARALARPCALDIEHNYHVAAEFFGTARLDRQLATLLEAW